MWQSIRFSQMAYSLKLSHLGTHQSLHLCQIFSLLNVSME